MKKRILVEGELSGGKELTEFAVRMALHNYLDKADLSLISTYEMKYPDEKARMLCSICGSDLTVSNHYPTCIAAKTP